MGIDPTKFGMKDYAVEFKEKCIEQNAYNRGHFDAMRNTTIPIGKEQETQQTKEQTDKTF